MQAYRLLIIKLAAVAVGVVLLRSDVLAQHAVDVERLSADGDHYDAWLMYTKLPKRRRTVPATIAAARSAWALGLVSAALEEFDSVLADRDLDKLTRGRIELQKGVIEYQEGRYRLAIVHAERASKLIAEAGPLRSRVWLLWAESLREIGQFGAAEEQYQKAFQEALPEERPEIAFLLGECLFKLSKLSEARKYYKMIPTQHIRSARAIRQLANIALADKEYEQTKFWLTEGRKRFPNDFLDSWVDYALVLAAIDSQSLTQLNKILESARKKYPPSDHWLTLMEAAAEQYAWARIEQTARVE